MAVRPFNILYVPIASIPYDMNHGSWTASSLILYSSITFVFKKDLEAQNITDEQ